MARVSPKFDTGVVDHYSHPVKHDIFVIHWNFVDQPLPQWNATFVKHLNIVRLPPPTSVMRYFVKHFVDHSHPQCRGLHIHIKWKSMFEVKYFFDVNRPKDFFLQKKMMSFFNSENRFFSWFSQIFLMKLCTIFFDEFLKKN